ncbi:phage portal protein [Vreelandella neptunia]|uniref:Phage portal protein n=1 Tax=Vreelandella neptunia TaxID=115551 RepID=A0ABZ0YKK6_9GAMM|nr:phage portal protein [Halomonas neptunia]MDN3561251.1 phage portal protein [Halomonas neptunia]WQH12486.1 phage portal protein [Halomonas neptunia]
MGLIAGIRKWMTPVSQSGNGGGWVTIHEPYTGAWQRNESETVGSVAAQSTIFACLSRISQDVGKLPFKLQARDANGLWQTTTSPAYSPLLRRPNHYQTPQQFREAWVLSRLQFGNTYALKERDSRHVVTSLHILDPSRVMVKVSDSGDVYYELATDALNGLSQGITVPAREIIHDRESTCLHHPLIGVPPLLASTLAATKNLKVDRSQLSFFANYAQPGGILTAPAGMTDDDAKSLKEYWNENFSGKNSGKISVIGADMKFTSLSFNAVDSQLVEQVKYNDEQICHAFGIPLWKIGLQQLPVGTNPDGMNSMYLADALQSRIQGMEESLNRGLGIGEQYRIEIDVSALIRLDESQQVEIVGNMIKSGIYSPNEARRRFNLPPITGGDSVYLQEQNHSLEALARRDESADPFGTGQVEERAMSPGLRRLQDVTQKHLKKRLRFDWDAGKWKER